MLWLLPINGPVLVVWVHNLAVHWLTPFSSHHNVLSIMPFILLVETLTSGKMVPRVTSKYVSLPIHIFPNPLSLPFPTKSGNSRSHLYDVSFLSQAINDC